MAKSPESKAFLNAARDGDLETIRLSLQNGVGVDIKSSAKTTSLIRAAGNGHLKIVQLLLESGAEINLKNVSGETALFRAAKNGHLKIVNLLIERDAIVDIRRYGSTALYAALLNGHDEIVKTLLRAGAGCESFLAIIVRHHKTDLLHRLIALGMNPNNADENGITELMRSATCGALEVAQILIHYGADVNARNEKGETALYRACAFDNPETARYLIECGARPRVIEAVMLGDLELVKRLIDEGADVNAAVNNNFPLTSAIRKQRADIVEILLQNGAKVQVGAPS